MAPELMFQIAAAVAAIVVVGVVLTLTSKPKVFLNKERQKLKLVAKTALSHDTFRFRFALPSPKMVLGLPVGKHFKVFAPNAPGVVPGQWNGRDDAEASASEINRSYTPTSSDDDRGYVELVIKNYERGVVERFPDGGKMSQYMCALSVGDDIALQGPFGAIEYKGAGLFMSFKKELRAKHVAMMAGGTGITPMLQVIAAVLKEPAARAPKLSLIFANQTAADILVREELEALVAAHPARFHLHYTLDRPPTDGSWKGSTGFIDQAMIREHLPPPGADTLVLMCGPPPMVKFACKQNLEALGYAKDRQLAF